MKKSLLVPISLATLLICFCMHAAAQNAVTNGTVKGRLADSTSKEPLKGATISLLNSTDSSVVSYVLSQDNGSFSFDKVAPGNYLLHISFQSYDNVFRQISLTTAKPATDIGSVYMQQEANVLEGVVIKSTPPISMKKDTFEFNAGSFKTKPNAVAEDLLKKLPGVEVDKDGTIKAQGEQVTRVLVNGKRFFGDDPQMATKNLPPDVIDKIQIYDAQSDQSAFSGFDDGNRVKTINIVIKKNKNKGYFGKAAAGIGSKDLYELGANVNRFNDNESLSVVAQSNNANKQNFSAQDVLGGAGGGGRGGGGGGGGMRRSGGGGGGNSGSGSTGLTTTYAAGINYRSPWSSKTEGYGSYFYNGQKTNRDQTSRTQTLVTTDTTTDNRQVTIARSNNYNHRFNYNIESKLDTNNQLIIRPGLSYQKSTSSSNRTTGIVKNADIKVSNGTTNSESENSGYAGNLDVNFQHRFKKRGRTVSFGLSGTYNSNDGDGNNFSVNQSYLADGINYKIDTVDQQNFSKVHSTSFSGTFSYTEPLSQHSQVELGYNFTTNANTSDRRTFNYDRVTHDYNVLDTTLTNNFESRNTSNRATLSYRIQYPKVTASIGTGVQFSELSSINRSKNTDLKQRFTNMYPTATLNYNIERQKSLRFNYDGRTNSPSVTQLQDVTDNSDPLNIKQGNPGLKQAFNHSFRLMYNSFSQTTMRNIFLTFNAQFTSNNITNSVTTILDGAEKPAGVPDNTPSGATVTRPVNLNGNYNMSLSFNYGLPLKSPKSNLNFGSNLTQSQTVNLQSDKKVGSIKNYTRNYALGGVIRWTTNLQKNFDVNFTSNSTYNIARYSVNKAQNGNYFSESLSTEFTYYTNSGWMVNADFDYKYYGRGAGYNTSVPLLTMYVAKQIFKDKSGEIKLSVYDLLNQNVSITRSFVNNTIQDVQNKVLTRYVMLTFTYNLRRFGDGKMPFRRGEGRPDGGGRGFDGGGRGGGYGGGRGGRGGF